MVLVAAVREYINRMVNDISGMKVLLLDAQTVGIVSVVLSQTQLLQKEVFLVEMLDSGAETSMTHLKAICFLRPTPENIQFLKRHLANPRFGEYHVFFSNIVKTSYLQMLADGDEHDAVQTVQMCLQMCLHTSSTHYKILNLVEFFADYFAIDPFHFSLNLPANHVCLMPTVLDPQMSQQVVDRIVEGITSLCLSLKRRPIVRYSRTSEIARRVAQDSARLMYETESGLFDFRRPDVPPLLLIVDRRDDPVTPLLNQWTYQAMVHELIGIQDNRVDLKHHSKVPTDQQEVVLSSEQDPFFKSNMYENFGDLGANIKRMVDEFQQSAKSSQNIQSLEDMARFVDNYPEYRKMQGNVSKHVTMMTEMSRIVDDRQLMSVSQTEQDLACNAGQQAAFEAVVNQLNNERIADMDRIRLVMLYALRYEKESPMLLEQLLSKLSSRSSNYNFNLVRTLLKQAGMDKRTGDLYGNRDLFNRARNMARGLKGVENVYTQHQPLIVQIIESVVKLRLRDMDYPVIGNMMQQTTRPPQDLIVFIVGGSTYEEARSVALHNAANPSIRVYLGGTTVLNTTKFLSNLEEVSRTDRKSYRGT